MKQEERLKFILHAFNNIRAARKGMRGKKWSLLNMTLGFAEQHLRIAIKECEAIIK